MDGGSNCDDCLSVSSHCRRAKEYNKANKCKRGFSSMKNRLKAQKTWLMSEVEKVAKAKDDYKNETMTLHRLVLPILY